MGTLGINKAWVGLVDRKTNKIKIGEDGINGTAEDKSGIFQVDIDSSMGIVGFNLTNMAGSQTDIYGSNKVVYVSQGKAAPQGVLTSNALPHDILNRILGRKDNGHGGFEAAGKNDEYVSILVQSSEAFEIEAPVYVGFYKATGQDATHNMQTNNATEQRQTDDITFKAVERGDDGFGRWYYPEYAAFTKQHMFEDFFVGADVSKFVDTPPTTDPVNPGTV